MGETGCGRSVEVAATRLACGPHRWRWATAVTSAPAAPCSGM